MADFEQNTNIKSAVRRIANPFADVDAFNAIVQSVILNNPFGCVSYMSSGVNHPPVEKTRESYTAKFVYQDENAKRIGSGSENYNTIAGYTAGIAAVLANTANSTAHGGTPARVPESDNFSATLKCHDPNGELYMLNISRQQVTLSSYEDDSIQTVIETWADGVSALAQVIIMVDNEILIMAAFLGAGLLAYVIIPGMLVIWDRVLDHMEQTSGNGGTNQK